ncbi:MAG TPA: DUF192 domain-containing protein [Verrucomicrobiae bacterium]|nr:DUF192 domain-containing protein [Verrucomicrobiae bacterium]
MKSFVAMMLAAAVFLGGCAKRPAPATGPEETHGEFLVPTVAQGKLPTIKLWLGSEELDTEVALTTMQQATGMMFRTNMPENTAMLFVRPQPEQSSFWMTNCPLPLEAAYIDPEGSILELHELKANDPTAVVAQSHNVQYVLEANSGWFERHHIPAGTLITTEHGSLPEIFLRRR